MEKIILYLKEHKRSVIIALVIFVLILLFLLLKACSRDGVEDTQNLNRYEKHVIASISRQNETQTRLLNYLGTFNGPIDCTEDVANQLASFSAFFHEESDVFERLRYLGTEPLQNGELYASLAANYRELGIILSDISSAMNRNDITSVLNLYDNLGLVLKALNSGEELIHE